MKKTLIASAVALATFATAGVNAAEVNLPKVYGNIQLVLSQENEETTTNGVSTNDSSYSHGDNGSTIGFSHDHEIMPGLTAFAKAEFEFQADELKNSGGLNGGDQAFLGVKGDFGTVKVGSYDTIYDDAINDTVSDVFEFYSGGNHTVTTNEGDTVTYYTPMMSGFSAAVALQINGEDDGSKLLNDGDLSNDAARNAALAVLSYEMGDTKVSLAWDSGDNSARHSAYGLAVTQGLGDFSLGFSFETQDENPNAGLDADGNEIGIGGDIIALRGTYTMGANQFQALYKMSDYDSQRRDDASEFFVQALHNMSDNMYVYVEATWAEDNGKTSANGDVETTGMAVGATYVF